MIANDTGNTTSQKNDAGESSPDQSFAFVQNGYRATRAGVNGSNFQYQPGDGMDMADLHRSQENAQTRGAPDMAHNAYMGRVNNDYTMASNQISGPGGPSDIATRVARQASDQGLAAQMAAAHSGSRNQAGVAAYNAANQGAQMQQAGYQNAMVEQSRAQQTYDQMGLQAAIANRQYNLQQLGMSQDMAKQQAQMDLARQGQNDAMSQWYGNAQLHGADQNLAGGMGYEGLKSGNYNSAQGINAGINAQNTKMSEDATLGMIQMGGSMMGAASDAGGKEGIADAGGGAAGGDGEEGAGSAASKMGGGGGGGGSKSSDVGDGTTDLREFSELSRAPVENRGQLRSTEMDFVPPVTSDRKDKSGVHDGDMPSFSDIISGKRMGGEHSEVDQFLSTLHPYTYKYKDASNEPTSEPNGGRYLGVMAQNVERSPTGSQIVKDTPRGKVLEGGALASALAAGVGRLHERTSALEAMMSAKGKA